MTLNMLKILFHRAGRAAILFATLVVPGTGALAQSYPMAIGEDASAKLARNVRVLGTSPKDFNALIAAGQASLELGDTQAAAGFFGRAEEVWPQSPLPQAGMGAAMVAMGDPRGALNYFALAQKLGASHASIAVERGLAFDLIGDQARAQSDYRAALSSSNANEARRRLALSLAISRDIRGARETLAPLLGLRDREAIRVNAFVQALAGDLEGARRSIDSTMPGAGARFEPFFRVLPVLRPDEKAAAVHLGEFPKDAAVRYTQAAPITSSPVVTIGGSRLVDVQPNLGASGQPPSSRSRYSTTRRPATNSGRLDEITQMLSSPADSADTPPPAPRPKVESTVKMANVQTGRGLAAAASRTDSASATTRIWLQLASGPNAEALPDQFRRIKGRSSELFKGISGYVAESDDRARLLIGPFRSVEEANIFAEDLATERVAAFSWKSPAGQTIRKLPTE